MRLFLKLAAIALCISMPAWGESYRTSSFAPDAHEGKFIVMYNSLVPNAPREKKGVMFRVDEGQRVHMRQYLGLPIDIRIDPDSVKGIYDVQILRENGTEIAESRQGFTQDGGFSTATFVDQGIQVSFGVWKRMIAQPMPHMVVQ